MNEAWRRWAADNKPQNEEAFYRCFQDAWAMATAEWVGLTDDELEKVFPAIATYHEANKTLYRSIARAIEAKLKEKNT
jgi:hypothetical protein